MLSRSSIVSRSRRCRHSEPRRANGGPSARRSAGWPAADRPAARRRRLRCRRRSSATSSGVGRQGRSRSNDSRRISVRRSASAAGRAPWAVERRKHEAIDPASRPIGRRSPPAARRPPGGGTTRNRAPLRRWHERARVRSAGIDPLGQAGNRLVGQAFGAGRHVRLVLVADQPIQQTLRADRPARSPAPNRRRQSVRRAWSGRARPWARRPTWHLTQRFST